MTVPGAGLSAQIAGDTHFATTVGGAVRSAEGGRIRGLEPRSACIGVDTHHWVPRRDRRAGRLDRPPHPPRTQARCGVVTCNAVRAAVITTPMTNFRALFYDPLPDGLLSARATSAVDHARQTCAAIAPWAPTDTLGQRRTDLRGIVHSTIDAEAAEAWQGFAAPLPDDMLLSELRDYIWVDNAQQRNDVL